MCPICVGTIAAFGAPGLIASVAGHVILVKGMVNNSEESLPEIGNPFL